MATSGVTTFSMTRDDIIYAAARKIGAVSDGQNLTPTQLGNGAQALNAMLKTFQTYGMPLWALKDVSFSLGATRTYNIGVGQTLNTPAPLKVIQATLQDTSCNMLYPLTIINRNDYHLLPTATSGVPNSLWYEPKNQTGVITLWPTPDANTIANRRVQISYQRPFEDLVSGTDSIDFPQHWIEAIVYGLAWRLAPEYGVPINDRRAIQQEAEFFVQEALSFGTEEGSLFIRPDWSRR